MVAPQATSASRPSPALRRWLRHTWLGRLAGRFASTRPQAAPKRKHKGHLPNCERLETRCTPDDVFGITQMALGTGALAELSGHFPTPTQVLLNGWSGTGSFQGVCEPRISSDIRD